LKLGFPKYKRNLKLFFKGYEYFDMRRIGVFVFILLPISIPILSFGQTGNLTEIPSKGFKRLYKLNDSIYRSEQPSRKGFQELEALGIISSITFRRNKNDEKKAKNTGLELKHIPLKTSELTEEELLVVMKAIQNAEKPVLIHCWHGSDRTGAISAAYRVIFENWTKEDAIKELRRPELGYHENWYPNVISLILNLDVVAIRKQLSL